MDIAVFPGSFDPITLGHENIIKKTLPLFDKLVIAVGENAEKPGLFSIHERLAFVKHLFEKEPKIEIVSYSGLTVEYCRSIGAKCMIRGLRTALDFEYEKTMALTNKTLAPEIETIFVLTQPEHSFINSSVVRVILKQGGKDGFIKQFVPSVLCQEIEKAARRKFEKRIIK